MDQHTVKVFEKIAPVVRWLVTGILLLLLAVPAVISFGDIIDLAK